MYMLRLISAVLHRARGATSATRRPTCAALELALVVPLVAALLFLSAWPAAISERSFPTIDPTRGGRVIPTPKVDWLALAPTLALLGASGVALLGSVLVPWWMRRGFTAFVAFAGFVTAGVFAAIVFDESAEGRTLIAESFTRDRLGALAAIIVAGAGALTVLVSWGEKRRDHAGEYYALLAAAGAGMAFFVTAGQPDDALPRARVVLDRALHPLRARHAPRDLARGRAQVPDRRRLRLGDPALRLGARLRRDRRARLLRDRRRGRRATTYLLLAGLAMLIAGLGFKASAAPFHMWTPDVYEGAPTSVTAFMSAATKVAALVVTLRILVVAFPEQEHLWTIAIAVLAFVSLAVGNLAALVQRNVKRLLAYSSVSHAGFMLIAVAANNELGGTGAPLLPDPVRRDVDRRVRGRRGARARARRARDARQPRRDGLGAAVPRRRDVGLHARLHGHAAHRRPARQVLRLLRRLRGRPVVADRRRRDRDGDLALLLPRRRPGALHAAGGASCGPSSPAARRRATRCSRAPSSSSRRSSRSARSSSCSR